MPTSLPAVVEELLPLLRQFVQGDYGIALGGAHAKGAPMQNPTSIFTSLPGGFCPATRDSAYAGNLLCP